MTASILNPNLSQGENSLLTAILSPLLWQCGAPGSVGPHLGGIGRAKFKREASVLVCCNLPHRRRGGKGRAGNSQSAISRFVELGKQHRQSLSVGLCQGLKYIAVIGWFRSSWPFVATAFHEQKRNGRLMSWVTKSMSRITKCL